MGSLTPIAQKGQIVFEFSKPQQQKTLFWLVSFHILIIASSNFLVQIPMTVFGFHSTWGALSFPFIFLATDLTVRIFGASIARRIIFWAMLPALLISYSVSVVFVDGQWTGLSSLSHFNLFVGRIALASFAAYVIGQLMDIFVFNRLRQKKQWWIAPAAAAVVGNAIDTAAFFSIAFYRTSDAYLSEHLLEIACVDYAFKVLACIVFFLPLYGILLRYLIKKLTQKTKIDHQESYKI